MLKQFLGFHQSFIQAFEFVKVKHQGSQIITDDLLLSCDNDGRVVLWSTNSESQEIIDAFSHDKNLPDQKQSQGVLM